MLDKDAVQAAGSSHRRFRALAPLAACAAFAAVTPTAAEANCGGLLAGILGSECPSREPAPDPGGVESADQPVPPSGKRFGFSTMLHRAYEVPVDQVLDAVHGAGVNAVRLPAPWQALQPDESDPPLPEPVPGSLVESLDAAYAGALARGITPVLTTYWAPLWATRYRSCGLLDLGCRSIAGSDHKLVPEYAFLDEYTAFVKAVKQRWPQALIESWNEPNLYWDDSRYRGSRDFAASPGHFARIQCAAYAGSKTVNDDPVLAAGWAGRRYRDYVGGVYRAGGHDCWDIANVHLYPGPQTEFAAGSRVAFRLHEVRELQNLYGDQDPIWITETGYTTTGHDKVSAATQAEASSRLYNRLVTMPDIEAVFFHTLRDAPYPYPPYNDPDSGEYGYGFLREDWRPKPVYCGFAERAGNNPDGC